MHWKNKLEDETAFLPGELAVNGAAWNKLYNRMQQPRRKKRVGYWAAAAGLALAVLLSVIFSDKQTINNTVVTSAPAVEIEKQLQKINEQKELVTILPKQKITSTTFTKQGNRSNVKQKGHKKKIVVTAPFIENDNITTKMAVSQTLLKTDSIKPSTYLVSVKQKAKLKVIHVNELGESDNNKYIIPGGDYSAIKFGIKSLPVNNYTTSPGKIGLNISTSKTSATN